MLKKYSLEFKSAAIHQIKSGKTITEVAKVFGITPATLHKWLHESRTGNDRPGNIDSTVLIQKISADGKLARFRAHNPYRKNTTIN